MHRIDRELLEAERKERELLDTQRIQAEKLAMQQKLKQNMLAQQARKKTTKYNWDLLHTDDETDDENNVVDGRPGPPEWSLSKCSRLITLIVTQCPIFRFRQQSH